MELKEHDFIEIDYTGKLKEDNFVFDTSLENVARDSGLFKKGTKYRPLIICLGERHVVPGLDKQLIGKEIGKEYVIELKPEEAFGKKNAKLLQLVPAAKFRQEQIMPMPGMQVSVDNEMGIIRTVSGGRILVDFNNPLAGKEIVYTVKANRLVDDDKEKVNALLEMIGMHSDSIAVADGKAVVGVHNDIPKELADVIEKSIIKLVPGVKNIEFVKHDHKKENKNESNKEDSDSKDDKEISNIQQADELE